MSQGLQSKYSRTVKVKQQQRRAEQVVERVTKLPSGKVASKALRERGRQRNE